MTKRFFSATLAALAILPVSSTAFAQQPQCCQADTTCQAPGKPKKKCKKQKANRQERCQMGDSAMCNPFEGLTLTAQQEAALKAIPTPCEVLRAAKKEQADTAVCRRVMVENVRKNYLAQVKAILSPEQYTQFLENFYTSAPVKMKKDNGPKPNQPKKKKGNGHRHHGSRR